MLSAVARLSWPGRAEALAWAEAEHGRFALWLPVGMTAGVVWYFSLLEEPPSWAGLVAAALALAVAIAVRGSALWRAAANLAVAIALGFTSAQFATWRAAPPMMVPAKATIVGGTITSVEILPSGRRVTLADGRFDGGPAQARMVRVKLRPADTAVLEPGDRISVRALLSRPSPPVVPGGWDMQRDAFFNGMGAFGYALNPVELVAHGPGGWLESLRTHVAARLRAVLPGAEGEIAVTLLTGTQAGIDEADRAAFRDSGLAHLLAIAGLHIGIVMGVTFTAVRAALAAWEWAALRWPLKAIASLAALSVGFGYLLMTGAHVPIIRSFAMAALVTLGILVGRRVVSLRGLGLAMAVLVVLAPAEVMGVSFQMSFSAVLALIVGYAALQPFLTALRAGGGWRRAVSAEIAALALTSALAGTASLPYAAYHFGHVQIYYVLANTFAVPIAALLAMPAGLAALVLMPLHLEALALVPMGRGVAAILWVAHAVAGLPAATFAVPHAPAWGLGVFSLGLAWFGIWRTRLSHLGWVAMAIGLASPWLAPPADVLVSPDGRLIGVHDGARMRVLAAHGGNRFAEAAWREYWAAAPPEVLDCPDSGCIAATAPYGRPALVAPRAGDAQLCRAAVIVSPEPVSISCADKVPVVDRFSVWREGAHGIWLRPDGVEVVSDASLRGHRPWVLRNEALHVPSGTRPAPAEVLPPLQPGE